MRKKSLLFIIVLFLFINNGNAGSFDWAKMISHGKGDSPIEAKYDRFGNILIVGTAGISNARAYISKYDSTGNHIFSLFTNVGRINSVGVDYSGNIYISTNG
ncbi:MAG: hypothetical protein IPN36_15525 [Bacteroidetes bacterium]|nr:hypothetical protein [Bacteroidota bacterium]